MHMIKSLRSRIPLSLSSTSPVDLPAMAWRFPVTPAKEKIPDLTRRAPARPRIGGGDEISVKREQLGSRETLEWRRLKLSEEQFAGSEISRAALARGGR